MTRKELKIGIRLYLTQILIDERFSNDNSEFFFINSAIETLDTL